MDKNRVDDEFVDELEQERAFKTYVIQRKVKWLTIATFILSMVMLLGVSSFYLFFLLD